MKELINFKDVKTTYTIQEKSFDALSGASFTINRGELVVILGPSGAGKSTILNLLGGMDKATSGEIIIDGKDISKLSNKELTKYRAENIGFIFQFYNILPTLTVIENVELINDIVKKPKPAMEVLKGVGLAEHAGKFPNQLSGGEQQRVSIARAIAKNPLLLLCDEPTGALDSQTGVEVLKLLKEQCGKDGNTVVIVTHNSLIADIADRVIRVKNGKIRSNEVNTAPKKIEEVEW